MRIVSVAAMILLGSRHIALAGSTHSSLPPVLIFGAVGIHIEYNAVDSDAKAVIVIDAGVGLSSVKVFAPNSRQVLYLTAKTTPNLGQTKLKVETPEPSLNEVKAAYPAGMYRFRGWTVDGDMIVGEATLSHDLLDAPVITAPANSATTVPINGQTATWETVTGAASYFLELEQEDLALVLKVDLLSSSTSFDFPTGWLLLDKDYVLSVSAIGANGNHTIAEVRFRTAP